MTLTSPNLPIISKPHKLDEKMHNAKINALVEHNERTEIHTTHWTRLLISRLEVSMRGLDLRTIWDQSLGEKLV